MEYNPIRNTQTKSIPKIGKSLYYTMGYATLAVAVFAVTFSVSKFTNKNLAIIPAPEQNFAVGENTTPTPEPAKETPTPDIARKATTSIVPPASEQPLEQKAVAKTIPTTPTTTVNTAVTAPVTNKYAIVITFSSYNKRLNTRAISMFDEYLSSIKKDFGDAIIQKKSVWGANSEFDYCIQLSGLEQSNQDEVVQHMKMIAQDNELVDLQLNAECHTMPQ